MGYSCRAEDPICPCGPVTRKLFLYLAILRPHGTSDPETCPSLTWLETAVMHLAVTCTDSGGEALAKFEIGRSFPC